MKRKLNTTALKWKYFGATNTNGSRIKFTQLNKCKSCIIPYDCRFDVLGKSGDLLERCPLVYAWNIIIDNTQNDYYLISFDSVDNSFPNLIDWIRKNN